MANKTNDITKTGPKSYRDLQKENDAAYQSALAESSMAQRMNFNRNYAPSTSFIYEGKEQSPILQQHNGDYWGNSMWDNPSANEEEFQLGNLNDTRAENQPWYAKLGAGLGKGAVLAGTTFLDGTIGLIAGLSTAIGEGRFSGLFDNEFSNGLNQINRDIETWLPNYRTQEEQNRPWYENLATVNFWADSFLKNLGFTVGAFYSGGAWNKVLKDIGLLRNGLGAAITGSLFSAVNEGRMEANNTTHDLLQLHTEQLQDAYNKKYQEIVNNNTLSDRDKELELQELDKNFDAETEKNTLRARQAGNIDLLGNTILLSLDNFNTYGRLFARGFKNAERTAQNSMRSAMRHADETISSRITRNAETGAYEFEKYGLKDNLLGGAKTAALEGNEEMAQQFLSNFSGNVRSYDSPDAYYNALTDSNAEQKTMDTTKALSQAFVDSYGDGQQWEQFAVGALTGILGMPTFGRVNNSDSNTYLGRGKVIGLSGGIFGQAGQNREANQRGQEIQNRMNSFAQKLQDHQRYFTQSQSFTDAMDGFAEDGDAFEFKNAEDNEAFAAMSAFAQAGRLDDYKQMVNTDFDNMSDEDLDAIVKMTSQPVGDDSSAKDQGWRNSDGSYMSETEEGRQQMRFELSKKRDKILAQVDAYANSLDKVRGIGNNSLTDDQVNELAWLDWKVGRFNDRLKEVTSEAQAPFMSIREGVNYMLNALRQEHDDIINNGQEDEKDSEGNNILKENGKQQKRFENISNVLTQLINGDIKGLASIKSKDFNDAINELNKGKFWQTFNSYSDISFSDYAKALTDTVDTFRLLGARNEFNQRLKEFTEDPLKLIQNRQKIDKKKENTEKAKSDVKKKDKIDNASVPDIVQQMENGDITDDDVTDLIDGMLDGDEDSSEDSAKNKLNNAREIVESSRRVQEKLDEFDDPEVTQQEIDDAAALLEASKHRASTKDELFDTSSEAWNDPRNILTDEDMQSMENPTPEERDFLINQRMDKAKNLMERVKSFIADEDQQTSQMPNTNEQAESDKKEADTRNKEKAKGKDAKGTVASSDTEAPTASAHKVDLGNGHNNNGNNNTDSDVNSEAEELIKDLVIPNRENTLNDTKNVLQGVNYLWQKGIRGKDLFNGITSTDSWKNAVAAIPDLGQRINNSLTNKYNLKPKKEKKEETKPETKEIKTPAIDNSSIATESSRQTAMPTEGPTYDYWKPTTTEIGIHDTIGNFHPFYETAKVINTVFDKLSKKQTLDPYEQLVWEQYIKPNYIRHPYTEQQLKRMEVVYNYLKDKGAFNTVNTGQVLAGTTIHFTIDNALNEQAGEPVVLMTLSDGTVVGDLSVEDRASQAFVKQVIAEWEKKGKPEHYTSDTTTTVKQMMRGKVPYINETHNLNEVMEGNAFKLGISMGRGENAPIVAEAGRKKAQGKSDFERTIVSPLNAVEGQPYLLLPTAGGMQRMCVPFTMKRYSEETANSKLGQAIDAVLKQVTTSASNPMAIVQGLEELLSAEFHVNYNGNNVVITYKPADVNHQTTIYNDDVNNPNLAETVKKALYGTPFQVSRKYINSTFPLNGANVDYDTMIGEVADVNLPLGTHNTINNWFTLNPVDGKAKRVRSTRHNPSARTADSVTSVNLAGIGDVTVNTSTWRVESADKALTSDQEDIARAIAYGQVTEGVDNTQPYQTKWGMFNPSTQSFERKKPEGVTLRHFEIGQEERKVALNTNDSKYDTFYSMEREGGLAGEHDKEGAALKVDKDGHFVPNVDWNNFKVSSSWRDFFDYDSNGTTINEAIGYEVIEEGQLEDTDVKGIRKVAKKGRIRLIGERKAAPRRAETHTELSPEQRTADRIQLNSEKMQLTKDKKYYVDSKGVKYARVTSIIQADVEGEAFDENSPWALPSTNIGTGLDEMGRDFISGRITFNPTTNAYEIQGVPVENIYPNIDRASATAYLNQWSDLKNKLDKRGIHLVPRDVVAKGILTIEGKDGKKHQINVAGTLDLLGYDDNGNWYIFDMKTHHSDTISAEKKAKWARQLALYKKFLEDEYGINVAVTAIIPTKVNYPAPSATNIYGKNGDKPTLYNGVESNQLTLYGKPFKESHPVMGSMIGPKELGTDKVSLNIQLDKLSPTEKAILDEYNKTKVTYVPQGHEVSGDLDKQAKDKGLTATKKNETVWNILTDEQKTAILKYGDMKAKQIMQKLAGAFNTRTGQFDTKRLKGTVDNFLGVGKNRVATTEKYTPWKPEREIGWLKKALPQFSDDEHLRITKGLIKLDGKRNAFGRFKKGVIYLSDTGARGTTYHEAFHAVFNTLLNNNEQDKVMASARTKFGDLGEIELEEKLAEDFRRYIQYEETPVIGTLVRAFRAVKHIIQNLLNNESTLNKLYYNINRGRFANRVAGVTEADRLRLTTADLNEQISLLDDEYRRGKLIEGTVRANSKDAIDNIIDSHNIRQVAYAYKQNGSPLWGIRVTKKNYNERRNKLIDKLNTVYNTELSEDERLSEQALNEQEEHEDILYEQRIEQWHRDEMMFSNLSQEDKDYLAERSISTDEYNQMSQLEKEVLFQCKY